MASPTGVEPSIVAVKGRCPSLLDDGDNWRRMRISKPHAAFAVTTGFQDRPLAFRVNPPCKMFGIQIPLFRVIGSGRNSFTFSPKVD